MVRSPANYPPNPPRRRNKNSRRKPSVAAVRFEFQCAAGGNAAIVGPGIGFHVDFGYVFAWGEYRYYGGDRRHGIGGSRRE